MLPVPVTNIKVPVKLINKGRPRKEETDFPVLLPSAWLKVGLETGGQMFLGGHEVSDESGYRCMLLDFWKKFQCVNPGFDFFARKDYNDEMAPLSIPCLVHGDEGRGKCKRPIMILAVQPLISWKGPSHVNSSGYLCKSSVLAMLSVLDLQSTKPSNPTRKLETICFASQAFTDDPNAVYRYPFRTLLAGPHAPSAAGGYGG